MTNPDTPQHIEVKVGDQSVAAAEGSQPEASQDPDGGASAS
jgi:hypothetical protein